MGINKRLIGAGATGSAGGLVPSEHFGVVLYEGDGASSHSINGGKFGAGAYFTGSASQIVLPKLALTSDVSVSMWVNLGSTTTSSYLRLFSLNAVSNGWAGTLRLAYQPSTGTFLISVGDGQSTDTAVLSHTNSLTQGTWYHIVATRDVSTNVTKLYINGSQADSETVSATATIQSNAFSSIGNQVSNYSGTSWEGKIDQVRIFQKELSSSEVSTLYAETTPESLDPLNVDTTDTLQVLGDSSCVATYRFENDETDLSGNYDGTGTAIQYAAGRYGQAASFNGSASRVINTASGIGNLSDTSISLSCWFKFTASIADRIYLVAIEGSGSEQYIGLHLSSNKCGISIQRGSGTQDYRHSANDMNDGSWHHLVLTRSSTTFSDFKAYLDGETMSTSSTSNKGAGTGITFNKISMGYNDRKTSAYYNGQLDQVRIFNKALSAAEVTTLYNENPLVASYRFEGNANDDMRAYDGTASNVTYEYGLGFTPDLVWIKERSAAESHRLFDTTRGATKRLFPDTTSAESTATDSLTSFDTGGFSVGSSAAVNQSGQDYVAWCLKGGGSGNTFNIDGSGYSTASAAGLDGGNINPTGASINTTAGFGIYKASPTTATQSISHGLNSSPDMYIFKTTNVARDWYVSFKDGATWRFGKLNSTDAFGTTTAYTANSSTMVIGGGSSVNEVVYAFHSVDGFSKFGSYTGNGSADGPIVETGFEPAFVMVKGSSLATQWNIVDNKRDTTNPATHRLFANLSNAEATGIDALNFLSNGFQIANNDAGYNSNNETYIYMAFAADPDTEAPTVAKSFSTVTYDGTGVDGLEVTGLGFKPGMVWIKNRDLVRDHNLADVVQGVSKEITPNKTEAQESRSVTSFDSDGFTLDNASGNYNDSSSNYVAWAWKADDNEPTIFGGPAVAVYKFEDNANDVTGNYNGTALNITYSSSGKFNKSAIFDGTSKISTSLDFDTYDPNWSISYWIKFTFDTNYRAILGSLDANDKNGMVTDIGTSGEIRFRLRNSTGSASSLSSTDTYGDGNWHHVVCVNSSTSNYLYIDGQLDSSISTSSVNHSGLHFGTFGSSSSEFFKGELDQVRIYNSALKQEQVTELYNETASDNDDLTLGGLPETIISANANAGFSIVKYEGNGGELILPTGLSSKVEFVITKSSSDTSQWMIWHKDLSGNSGTNAPYNLYFATDAELNLSAWGTYNQFTATTFPVTRQSAATAHNNNNNSNYIAYCFHSVSGYSKFGSYSGNGSSSGPTVTTGFRPDFVMMKSSTYATTGWIILDSVRSGSVDFSAVLQANLSNAESDASVRIETSSTGFQLTTSSNSFNKNGETYIYMAFKIN